MEGKEAIETTTVSTRITKPMHKAVLNFLSINAHINVADYLRDLIRKDLENRGIKIPSPQRMSEGLPNGKPRR